MRIRATVRAAFQRIFRLREPSLGRGILLALVALAASLRLAGFPDAAALHGTAWQFALVPLPCWALGETARCLGRRWSFRHAGVLVLLYTELIVLALVLFLGLYL